MNALQNHFKPSESYRFRVHTEYGKKRSFQLCWLKEHNWLAYSAAQNGNYCKVCVLFGSETGEKNSTKLDKLVKSPVTFWTTASQKFKDHETKSQVHKTAVLKAETFMKVMHCKIKPIDQQLQSVLATQVAENRQSYTLL